MIIPGVHKLEKFVENRVWFQHSNRPKTWDQQTTHLLTKIKWLLIVLAVPGDHKLKVKIKLTTLGNTSTYSLPECRMFKPLSIIKLLGTVTANIKKIGIKPTIPSIQKTLLFGSLDMLQKVLFVWGRTIWLKRAIIRSLV